MERMSLQRLVGKCRPISGSTYVVSQYFQGHVKLSEPLFRGGGKISVLTGVQEDENLLRCDDPKPPAFHDVPPVLADAAALSIISSGLTSVKSPCPAATWDTEAFKDRCAYIRTLHDRALPYEAQNMMLEATGQKWITRDIETGHSPQLAAPEKLSGIILELAKHFEAM